MDWEEIWVEIISGVITGLVVGVVLWFFQKGREKRERRDNYERDLVILKAKLQLVNFDEYIRIINNIESSIPRFVKEVMDLLKNEPVELFVLKVKNEYDLAYKLFEVKGMYLTFLKTSNKLDIKIDGFLRHNNIRDPFNDINFKYYFVAKVYDSKDETIEPWFNAWGEINDEMRNLFNKFKEEYSDLIEKHINYYDILVETVQELEELVNADDKEF